MYRRYLQVCASPGIHQTQPDNLAYPETPPVTTAAEPTWNKTLSMANKFLFYFLVQFQLICFDL